MDSRKIGQFIAEERKQKQLTQKDLAEKVGVTDKAVSKWERGLSCPDISLLAPLSEMLDVTISELLNGEKSENMSEKVEESVDHALQYAEKTVGNRVKSLQDLCAWVFSLLLFGGVFTCVVCDVAITGGLSWSLYPISAIIFTWLVFFPVVKFGKKGIVGTLIALSVLIIPFLYVIDVLVKSSDLILPVGMRMAVLSVAYLWGVYGVFRKCKKRRLFAVGLIFLLAIPIDILINISLAKMISLPIMTKGDVVEVFLLAVFAIVFFLLDRRNEKICYNGTN